MYLNVFALSQSIELRIIATWVHLSTYLLFAINLFRFKLFDAESAVLRTAFVKHTDLKFPDKEIHFFLQKKGQTRKE